MKTKLYKWLLLKFLPGKRLTWKIPSIKGWKYHKGYELLQPGDIILSIDNRALTGAFIKFLSGGQFSHGSVCVGKYPHPEIAEMLAEGFCLNNFYDIIHEAERVVIMRALHWSQEYRQAFIDKVLSFKGIPYDVSFELGVEAFYCTEEIYQGDFDKTLNFNLEDFAGLGRPYLSPQGVYECQNLVVIWDSAMEGYVFPF